MKEITKKELLAAQQAEVNAVVLYKKLADRVAKHNATMHKTLLGIASDEGKHANMLRKLTGEIRQPKDTLANIIIGLTYILGKKRTLTLMAKAEHQALETYKPFVAKYPELEEMRLDEGRHGDLLLSVVAQL